MTINRQKFEYLKTFYSINRRRNIIKSIKREKIYKSNCGISRKIVDIDAFYR